jgi:hypothetical protein
MRRAWAFVGAVGLVFAAFGQADIASPSVAAAITVAASVALALLAHGGQPLAAEAVAFGASGALAYEAMRPYLPLVASGLLLTFVFGTRAMRAKTWRELLFHLGVAFVGGVAASWVARAQAGSDVTLWLLGIVVAAVLASVPWLLPADGPRAFALRRLAAKTPKGPLKVRLLRAVIAARRIGELAEPLPRRVHKRIARAFDDVIAIAERRLEGRGSPVMERDLSRTVDHLGRIARAANRRTAILDGMNIDASALKGEQESLEAEVAALVELR